MTAFDMQERVGEAGRVLQVTGADGVPLQLRHWPARGTPRGAVALVHGFKSHSRYFGWAASQLAAHGFAVHAVDLRGRGGSGGPRFRVEHVEEYLTDVATLLAYVRAHDGGLPIFLLGHSAGGVIASLFALDHPGELAGLISESFAFRVPAPAPVLALTKVLARLVPGLPVLKLPNAAFSRDPAVVAAMDADPHIAGEVQPAVTVAAMLRGNERLERGFAQVTLPLLILHGTADQVTLPEGSRRFHAGAGAADKMLRLYDGHAHDLLNDVDRERVMRDIIEWIEARLPVSTR